MDGIKIKIGLTQDGVKPFITLTTNFEIKDFAHIHELKQDNVNFIDYATLEKNSFFLNGKKKILTDEYTEGIGICSKIISDDQCIFPTPLILQVDLAEPIKNKGISMTFNKYSYPSDVHIEYYLNGTVNFTCDYAPTYYEYNFAGDEKTTYDKVIITFKRTNYPYRYLKITKLDFGQIITFDDDQIISSNILEELNLISNEVSTNTAEFELYSRDDEFNMFNPSGIYSKIKLNQPVEIFKLENDEEKFMGKFYLTEWSSDSENFGKFKAQDLIGYLKNIDYNKPFNTYTDKENIMDFYQVLEKVCKNSTIDCNDFFIVDNDKRTIKFCSAIAPGNIKDILQKMCFSSGATIDCSRKRKISIGSLKPSQNPKLIDKNRTFTESLKVKKINKPNSINIYGYDYENGSSDTSQNKLYSATIVSGRTHTVTFNSPKKFLNFSSTQNSDYKYQIADGIYVVEYSPFHITFYIDETTHSTFPVDVIIYGNDMKDYKSVVNYNTQEDDEIENAITIDCDLIHLDDESDYIHTKEVSEHLTRYYENLYELECEIELEDEKVGDYVRIKAFHDKEIIGYITSLDIDMTGGYITKLKLLGKVNDNES